MESDHKTHGGAKAPIMAAARGTDAGCPARDGRGLQSMRGMPGPSTGAPWHQVPPPPPPETGFPRFHYTMQMQDN